MVLFFDTETTGKPKDYKASMQDVDNWPRVTQMAWMICDDDGTIVRERTTLIRPEGWVVPKEKFFIDNNMSTERCEAEGRSIKLVLNTFLQDQLQCQQQAAHNMSFDYNVVGAELIRAGMKYSDDIISICTMQRSTDYCRIKGPYGNKWPTLVELHRKIFNEDFDGAHDALHDVKATAKCYFALKKIGVIK